MDGVAGDRTHHRRKHPGQCLPCTRADSGRQRAARSGSQAAAGTGEQATPSNKAARKRAVRLATATDTTDATEAALAEALLGLDELPASPREEPAIALRTGSNYERKQLQIQWFLALPDDVQKAGPSAAGKAMDRAIAAAAPVGPADAGLS